jgi:hypothetical protein
VGGGVLAQAASSSNAPARAVIRVVFIVCSIHQGLEARSRCGVLPARATGLDAQRGAVAPAESVRCHTHPSKGFPSYTRTRPAPMVVCRRAAYIACKRPSPEGPFTPNGESA